MQICQYKEQKIKKSQVAYVNVLFIIKFVLKMITEIMNYSVAIGEGKPLSNVKMSIYTFEGQYISQRFGMISEEKS
jgi:hypothetical protein